MDLCILRYFLNAGDRGIGRKLFSVPVPTNTTVKGLVGATALTEDETQLPSYYSASFSPQSGFYLLSYEGPNVPWQRLIRVDALGMSTQLVPVPLR